MRQFLLHGITTKAVPSAVMAQLYEVAESWDLPGAGARRGPDQLPPAAAALGEGAAQEGRAGHGQGDREAVPHVPQREVVDLELKLQDRDDDLAAARAANRELMAQLNRDPARREE
ncbi:hypothetical protein [Streptomyces decoyicus]